MLQPSFSVCDWLGEGYNPLFYFISLIGWRDGNPNREFSLEAVHGQSDRKASLHVPPLCLLPTGVFCCLALPELSCSGAVLCAGEGGCRW